MPVTAGIEGYTCRRKDVKNGFKLSYPNSSN